MIDTAYSGHFTLPEETPWRLGFPVGPPFAYSLVGNAPAAFDAIEASLLWDGKVRYVFALQTDGTPLNGMRLLKGYRLTVDVLDGGEVRIEKL